MAKNVMRAALVAVVVAYMAKGWVYQVPTKESAVINSINCKPVMGNAVDITWRLRQFPLSRLRYTWGEVESAHKLIHGVEEPAFSDYYNDETELVSMYDIVYRDVIDSWPYYPAQAIVVSLLIASVYKSPILIVYYQLVLTLFPVVASTAMDAFRNVTASVFPQ